MKPISHIRDKSEAILYRLIAGQNTSLSARSELRHSGLRSVRRQWWLQSQLEPASHYWCYLYLLEKTGEPRTQSTSVTNNHTIAVYSPGHIGDILLTVPMMRALRRKFETAEIVWIVGPWMEELAKSFPYATRVETFAPLWRQYRRDYSRKTMRDHLAWIRSCAHLSTDVFISTAPATLDTFLVGRALRPRRWFGRGPDFPAYPVSLVSTLVPPDQQASEAEDLLRIVHPLGISSSDCTMEFPLNEKDRIEAHRLLAECSGFQAAQPYAVISPGAGWPGKQWIAERWAAVGNALADRGYSIVLTGSRAETEMAGVIERNMKHTAVNMAGRTSLQTMAAIIAGAKLWLGCDSGSMHISAAVGTPSIALFGPTNPKKWAPAVASHTSIFVPGQCAGCVYWHPSSRCDYGQRCMKAIQVSHVLVAVEEKISIRQSSPENATMRIAT